MLHCLQPRLIPLAHVSMCVHTLPAGTTFPLVFTIQQAFTRRDKAISIIADLKATAIAIYFMHRDWAQVRAWPVALYTHVLTL